MNLISSKLDLTLRERGTEKRKCKERKNLICSGKKKIDRKFLFSLACSDLISEDGKFWLLFWQFLIIFFSLALTLNLITVTLVLWWQLNNHRLYILVGSASFLFFLLRDIHNIFPDCLTRQREKFMLEFDNLNFKFLNSDLVNDRRLTWYSL